MDSVLIAFIVLLSIALIILGILFAYKKYCRKGASSTLNEPILKDQQNPEIVENQQIGEKPEMDQSQQIDEIQIIAGKSTDYPTVDFMTDSTNSVNTQSQVSVFDNNIIDV